MPFLLVSIILKSENFLLSYLFLKLTLHLKLLNIKNSNTCIPLVKIPHPTPDKVQRCLRQRWLFNTYGLPVPPGGEEVEELNWIKETITDRKRQILLIGLGFEGYCTQQSVSWTGEWQCKGMTSIPLHWLTTLHKLFDLSQSYQHPWDLWEFLPIIQ